MKISYENFGAVNIIRFEGEAGPITILFDGGDGGGYGITASGHVVPIPPNHPEGEQQVYMEFMKRVRDTFSPANIQSVIGRCALIDSQIISVARRIAELAEARINDLALEEKLEALLNAAKAEGCPIPILQANPWAYAGQQPPSLRTPE